MDDREVFLRVMEAGSFTEAAAALDVSTSYVSRRVRALESQLGVRLLERTTRSVAPTEIGNTYAARVAPLLEALADADAAVLDERLAPTGRLRVALPLAFGLRYLQPLVEDYAHRYPEVVLEVSYSDQPSDLLAERFDIAVRGGRLEDSSFTARRLCGIEGRLVASPGYLAERGVPQHPDDLLQHEGIEYSAQRTMEAWVLRRGDEVVQARPRTRLRTDSGEASMRAAIAGLGIAEQPSFLVDEPLAAGELVAVLPEWAGMQGAFWAVTPSHRYLTRRVRLFLDLLVEGLSGSTGPGATSPSR